MVVVVVAGLTAGDCLNSAREIVQRLRRLRRARYVYFAEFHLRHRILANKPLQKSKTTVELPFLPSFPPSSLSPTSHLRPPPKRSKARHKTKLTTFPTKPEIQSRDAKGQRHGRSTNARQAKARYPTRTIPDTPPR